MIVPFVDRIVYVSSAVQPVPYLLKMLIVASASLRGAHNLVRHHGRDRSAAPVADRSSSAVVSGLSELSRSDVRGFKAVRTTKKHPCGSVRQPLVNIAPVQPPRPSSTWLSSVLLTLGT